VEPASWQKAKDVIVEALGRPAQEREAFVRERCTDPALCADVLAVLASGAAVAELVATQTMETRLFAPDDRAGDGEVLQLGTQVGPYLIVDHIGHGGMGRVFLGTDPRLQRRVALKCLLDSRATEADVRSRIIHEARAAARISNQHIAVVHDVIEHASRAFIVMEYVDGETLAARIRRGALPVAQTIAFGRQLASALAAAHDEGIVHRDLKPGNIQVTPAGVVKVLDFGIASATKLLSSPASTASTTHLAAEPAATLPRPAAGTPPYMSPEQLLGRDVDERSDIYSLGAVMFEMCTGQRPYPGKIASEIAVEHAKGVPRADAVDQNVPRPLADVIARAMAIDAAQRFRSAVDLDAALEKVERQLEARPSAGRQPLTRRLTRFAIGVLCALAALWMIGFVTTVHFNGVFGRDGQFARFGTEPWLSYVVWGLLAVVPVVLVMTLAAVVIVATRFVVGLLTLVGPVGRLARRLRAEGRRLIEAASLDTSAALAQALTGLAIATLALFFWRYADLIRAWTSFFNSSPIEKLMPMTDSAPARNQYHIELSVMTLVFGYGFYQVVRLRRLEHGGDGRLAVVMLGVVIAIMVLMNETPYRAFQRRDFERVDLSGTRCYITGESGSEFLVLCPGAEPPRNRAIRRDDPRLRRLGITENVFKGIDPGRGTR
jgi:serine/threonine protein kinase